MPSSIADEHARQRQVRVRGRGAEPVLDVGGVAAPGLDADRDRAVLEAPRDARRRVGALAVALGAVDGRPEDRVERRRVLEQAADRPAELGRQLALRGVPEDVAVALEEAHVQVAARAAGVDEGLRHEAREQAVLGGDLLRVRLVREVVVAAREALDRRERELVLGRAPLLVERARPQAERLQVPDDLGQHWQSLVRQRRRDVGAAEGRQAGLAVEQEELVLGLHQRRQALRGGALDRRRSTRRGLASTGRPSLYSMSQITRAWPATCGSTRNVARSGRITRSAKVRSSPKPGAGREPALVIPAEDVADEREAAARRSPRSGRP